MSFKDRLSFWIMLMRGGCLVPFALEMVEFEERLMAPPCLDCGAEDLVEAGNICNSSGEFECHGCRLWEV